MKFNSSGLLKALNILMVAEGRLKWLRSGHATVIEVVYNELPADIKKNLVLEKMIDASDDPDNKFHDIRSHSYPKSYKKAVEWLEKGKKSYNEKDFENASYCFGVASHYICDTFSAPHCVEHEEGNDHHDFEEIADELTPQIVPVEGDLKTLMQKGVAQGKLDWKKRSKTSNRSLAQSEVNQGASVVVLAIKNSLQ